MVQPPAQHAKGDHEGGADAAQGLVEIGGLLFVDAVQHRGQPRPRGSTDAVEVADHRHRRPAQCQGAVRAAVGGHHHRGTPCGHRQIPRTKRPAGHQGDPRAGIDNRLIHADTVPD